MSADDLDTLPLAQRLALSYAPAASRDATLTLLLLDNRLAAVLRQRGENALIAQMKLAWWRDRFGQQVSDWPKGEPLLGRIKTWPVPYASMVPLVDGWEALLVEELDEASVKTFAQGRGQAWRAVAVALCGFDDEAGEIAARAGQEWALADLAMHLGQGDEAELVRELAFAAHRHRLTLPRALRPLRVLHGLSQRALKRGSTDLLDGPGAMLTALQLGILGR